MARQDKATITKCFICQMTNSDIQLINNIHISPLNLTSEASRCNCTEWVRATSYWETVLHVRQVKNKTGKLGG